MFLFFNFKKVLIKRCVTDNWSIKGSMASHKWFVQKKFGCYKLVVQSKKSGTSEKDIMAEAHAFYCQEGNGAFNHEFAWQLLKDEPRWMGASTGCSSKRTKTSESGAYTTSSNP
jgi:hypothetical protein